MDDDGVSPPPPIPSRPTVRPPRVPSPSSVPAIPPRPSSLRARSKSPARAMEEYGDSSIPAIPARPSRQVLAADDPLPSVPPRPSKGAQESFDIPPIPQRPTRVSGESAMPVGGEDYLIDGIEKRVPLLHATTDVDDGAEDLTPSLSELVSDVPGVPRRPGRQVSAESDDVPVVPRRPGRKMSAESVDDGPVIPTRPARRESLKSNASIDDEDQSPVLRKTTSIKSIPESDVLEEPFIPPRPARKTSIKSIPEPEESSEPAIPARPQRKSSIKSITENLPATNASPEPIIPPRPARPASIKSVTETEVPVEEPFVQPRPTRTTSVKSNVEKHAESPAAAASPVIPPRPARPASIKSIPEKEVPIEEEPVVPARPSRKASIKSIPETEIPIEPLVPPRPTRTASVKSVPEREPPVESEPAIPSRPTRKSSIKSIPEPEPVVEEPIVPPRPTRKTSQKSTASAKEAEEADLPPVKSDLTTETPAIPQRPTRKSSIKSFKSHHSIEEEHPIEPPKAESPKDSAPAIEEVPHSPHQHPSIPPRPKKIAHEPTVESKPDEPAIRTAGIAALEGMPSIPPRPSKSIPKVVMDQTPTLVRTEGGTLIETVQPLSTPRPAEPKDILAIKPQPSKSPDLPIKPKPPVPARPALKLAKQFEAVIAREKPVPPPRPAKKPIGAEGRFGGLRAQFARDLNERLAKPPPVVQKEEEVVHSMEPEGQKAGEDGAGVAVVAAEGVGDVRKGRARGPQRRPPTVKPIIPEGWGISGMARVFELRPVTKGGEEDAKADIETQTGETVIESPEGVKKVYLAGGVEGQHVVVPVETEKATVEEAGAEGEPAKEEDATVHEDKPAVESPEEVQVDTDTKDDTAITQPHVPEPTVEPIKANTYLDIPKETSDEEYESADEHSVEQGS